MGNWATQDSREQYGVASLLFSVWCALLVVARLVSRPFLGQQAVAEADTTPGRARREAEPLLQPGMLIKYTSASEAAPRLRLAAAQKPPRG